YTKRCARFRCTSFAYSILKDSSGLSVKYNFVLRSRTKCLRIFLGLRLYICVNCSFVVPPNFNDVMACGLSSPRISFIVSHSIKKGSISVGKLYPENNIRHVIIVTCGYFLCPEKGPLYGIWCLLKWFTYS